MDNQETVTFDVGGKLFKVSRSLIDQFSDTMLGRIVSDTWQRDSNATVFIDRDGDIFAHVLNFLRYGSIVLPIAISRAMFDREMDYYGIITDVNSHTIKQQSSIDALQLVKNKLADAELEHDMFIIAVHAYHNYMIGKKSCFFNEESKIGLCRNPYHHSLNPRLDAKKILKEHLAAYYGIDACSINFSQQCKGVFPLNSGGVSLNMRNGTDSIFDSPLTCGLLQDGEWRCGACSTKNSADEDNCMACEEAKPAQPVERLLFQPMASGRVPSHSFGAWNDRTETQF